MALHYVEYFGAQRMPNALLFFDTVTEELGNEIPGKADAHQIYFRHAFNGALQQLMTVLSPPEEEVTIQVPGRLFRSALRDAEQAGVAIAQERTALITRLDRKSTRLNSSH